MFQDAARRPREGMFAAKVRQHPIQPPRPSAGIDAQTLGQGPPIVLVLVAPDPIPHAHQPEDTPPRPRFFAAAHGGVRTFEFVTHALPGPRRPLVHAGMAQLPQLLDEPRLDFIGSLQWPLCSVGEFQDAWEARQKLCFRWIKRVFTVSFILHPDSIEASGCFCTFYPAKSSTSLTRF